MSYKRGTILNEVRRGHREMAKRRGPAGLMKMYGYTKEEADLIWEIDFGGGYERWMETYGKGMADVVAVYNSTRRKSRSCQPRTSWITPT